MADIIFSCLLVQDVAKLNSANAFWEQRNVLRGALDNLKRVAESARARVTAILDSLHSFIVEIVTIIDIGDIILVTIWRIRNQAKCEKACFITVRETSLHVGFRLSNYEAITFLQHALRALSHI